MTRRRTPRLTVEQLETAAKVGALLEAAFPDNMCHDHHVWGDIFVSRDGIVIGSFQAVDEWWEFKPGDPSDRVDVTMTRSGNDLTITASREETS